MGNSSTGTLVKAHIEGIVPMLLHASTTVDPTNPMTKDIKRYTSKRKKTDEDYEEIARLEWRAALYTNAKGEPCMPGECLDALLISGAKKAKRGKDFQSSVFTTESDFPLLYAGPRDPEKMWASGQFKDTRMAKVGQARVMRCRPRFNKWAIEFTIQILPGAGVNPDEVADALEKAGTLCGLCDYRPRFGRFRVASFE